MSRVPSVFSVFRTSVLVLVAVSLFSAVTAADRRLRVTASPSLVPVLEEAARLFKVKGVDLRITVDSEIGKNSYTRDLHIGESSGKLEQLEGAGGLLENSRRNLASSDLVVIVPPGRALPWIVQDLMRPEFDIIALPHPERSPLGVYARDALKKIGVFDALLPHIVRVDDPLQVADHVSRGDVAAGVVYASDAHRMKGRVVVGPRFPDDSHPRLLFQGAVLNGTAEPELAVAFLAFLAGTEGQELFKSFGFSPP